jgi:phenylacetate-CoA ligase
MRETRLDRDRRYWDPVAQSLPRPKLLARQAERLQQAVARAHEASGFFRRHLDAAGVRPSDVNTPADLKAVPPVRKGDLRDNEAARPPIGDYRCVGLDGAVRLATSTGTTGRATFTLWTAADLRLDYELAARAHWRAGLRPGQVVVTAHPGYLNGGQAMTAGAYEHMGVLPISVGPPESIEHAERVLRTLEGIPIDHWRVFPAALARFREAAARSNSPVVLPDAETVGPHTQHEKLSAGQECISYLGSACAPGRGSHIAEDFALVEILDVRSGEPVPDGSRGTMVVTSLGRDNPMIRYDLEDIVRVESGPCPCGETSVRGFWEGRGKDAVFVRDQMILPIDVWLELEADAEFVLVRRPGATELEVRVEGRPADDLVDRLAVRCGVPVRVSPIPAGSLERSGYKAVRVVDEAM